MLLPCNGVRLLYQSSRLIKKNSSSGIFHYYVLDFSDSKLYNSHLIKLMKLELFHTAHSARMSNRISNNQVSSEVLLNGVTLALGMS